LSLSGNIIPLETTQTSSGFRFTKELPEPPKEGKQMNANTSACAPSGEPVDWRNIDWVEHHRIVRRLQARIVKAVREGRWGKVKALQWLLTHSLSGKMLAVRRVTENNGRKTPGVDGKTWSTPNAKSKAVLSLRRQGYNPNTVQLSAFRNCRMALLKRFARHLRALNNAN